MKIFCVIFVFFISFIVTIAVGQAHHQGDSGALIIPPLLLGGLVYFAWNPIAEKRRIAREKKEEKDRQAYIDSLIKKVESDTIKLDYIKLFFDRANEKLIISWDGEHQPFTHEAMSWNGFESPDFPKWRERGETEGPFIWNVTDNKRLEISFDKLDSIPGKRFYIWRTRHKETKTTIGYGDVYGHGTATTSSGKIAYVNTIQTVETGRNWVTTEVEGPSKLTILYGDVTTDVRNKTAHLLELYIDKKDYLIAELLEEKFKALRQH